MTYHLPALPDTLAPPYQGFTPRESFSPSQLAAYASDDGCKRKWAYRSLFGVTETKRSIATVLGSLIHGSLEQYLNGKTVYDLVAPDGSLNLDKRTLKEVQTVEPARLAELVKAAPARALAGLNFLPNMNDPAIEIVEVERWIDIDSNRIIRGVEPIKINGKIDLSMRRVGVWYLYDHKSTRGRRAQRGLPADPWAYCKTPEQLMKDPQAVFYALDVVLRHNLDALWCRWVYYLTDPDAHPQAKAVDVELRRDFLLDAAFRWMLVAHEMRGLVRRALAGKLAPEDIEPPSVLPPEETSPCKAYGGCPYHYGKGGPCMPEGRINLGNLILSGNQEPGKEATTMSAGVLADQFAATQAALGLPVQSPLLPPEAAGASVPPPAVANALPAPPNGFEYGPGNALRAIAPQGYVYNEANALVPYTPPPPPVVTAPPVVPGLSAPPPIPEQPEAAPTGSKKGRPQGSKNKKVEDIVDLLIEAVKNGHPVVSTITAGQLNAIREVVEAAA